MVDLTTPSVLQYTASNLQLRIRKEVTMAELELMSRYLCKDYENRGVIEWLLFRQGFERVSFEEACGS